MASNLCEWKRRSQGDKRVYTYWNPGVLMYLADWIFIKQGGGATRTSKKRVVALDLLSLHPTRQRMANTNHCDHLICTVRSSDCFHGLPLS